jgi:hypothetical protein
MGLDYDVGHPRCFCAEAKIPQYQAMHKMTQHDSQERAPAIADVRSRQLGPARLLGDSHYGSTESVKQCQSEEMALRQRCHG